MDRARESNGRFVSINFLGLPELKAKLTTDEKARVIGTEKGMLRALIYLQSYIRERKLHGDPLKSHHGAAGLSGNVAYTEPQLQGDSIIGTEGTNKIYGPVHEFGGTFTIREHIRRVSQVFGRQLSEPIEVLVRQHKATYPERSYLRSSLKENIERIKDFIAGGIRAGA